MKITVHPSSTLLGALALATVLIVAGAMQAPTASGHRAVQSPVMDLGLTIDGSVHVEGIPRPEEMMRIEEGTPFTVPAGKALVLTALGSAQGGSMTTLLVDGVAEFEKAMTTSPTPGSMMFVPAGFRIDAGSVVTVSTGFPADGRAWGYLVDA